MMQQVIDLGDYLGYMYLHTDYEQANTNKIGPL